MGDEITLTIADILKTIERWVIDDDSESKGCGFAARMT